jgi:hypothetical protein
MPLPEILPILLPKSLLNDTANRDYIAGFPNLQVRRPLPERPKAYAAANRTVGFSDSRGKVWLYLLWLEEMAANAVRHLVRLERENAALKARVAKLGRIERDLPGARAQVEGLLAWIDEAAADA